MARKPLAVGKLGEVRYFDKNGKVVARADGRVSELVYKQVQRSGTSKSNAKLLVEDAWKVVLAEAAMKVESTFVEANAEREARFAAEEEAEAKAAVEAAVVADVARNGTDIDSWTPETRLETVIDEFEKYLARTKKLAPATKRQYGKSAARLRMDLGTTEIGWFTKAKVRRYLEGMAKKGDKGWVGVNAKIVLGLILHIPVDHNILVVNAALGVSFEKPEVTPARALTPAELLAIEKAIEEYEAGEAGKSGPKPNQLLGVAVKVLRGTGARTCEMLALRWMDLDLGETPTMEICGTLIQVKGPIKRQEFLKSEAGHRKLTLAAATADALRAHYVHAKREAEHRGYPFTLESPVFQSRTGGWWRDCRFRSQFRAATGHLGIEGLIPYSFRKTIATYLERQTGDANASAATLGHASPAITLRHYIQQASDAGDWRKELDGLA